MIEDGNLQEQTSAPENTVTDTQTNVSNTPNPAEKPQDRTFTRDEVTEILKKRLERSEKKLWTKLGIEGKDKLDEYLENHNKTIKDLEDSNIKYDELDNKYKQLYRDYVYLKNDVIPEKYADLDKHFTSNELTEDNLLNILKNHPEFVKPKQVIPQQIGQQQNGQQTQTTEKELAEKLFGVKL